MGGGGHLRWRRPAWNAELIQTGGLRPFSRAGRGGRDSCRRKRGAWGIRLHLKLVCGREWEDRGYAGDARPCAPRPGVVADVWERASGREWGQQGRRGLGMLNLQGPRAGRDREPGQPGMPWPHVPNETAYGLMKAVSRVEKNGKRKATLKEKKRSACAGELLREQTERKQRHSRSHTRLAREAGCTQTPPSATPRDRVSLAHASRRLAPAKNL